MGSLLRWIDDFYSEPDLVREIALRSEYFVPEGFYGPRSTKGFLPRGTIEKIQESFGFTKVRLIATAQRSTHFYHCLVHGKHRSRFFAHIDGARDARHPLYSMVVYLTLRPPKDSGSGIFRHRKTGLWQEPTSEDAHRLGQSTTELEAMLDADAGRRSRWELLESSEHVYNRAVLFPAHWYHSSCRDFGSRLETGRLYQAFFFYGYPEPGQDQARTPDLQSS